MAERRPLGAVRYVNGADRMITAGWMAADGVGVRFADSREGVIPFEALNLPHAARSVEVPRPQVLEVQLVSGAVEVVPWDFARHFADSSYRARSETVAASGRSCLGARIRTLRAQRTLSQEALAERAGLSRVSVARIEAGNQLPRYGTIEALARALGVAPEALMGG